MPIIPGHEIVGRIDALGAGVADLKIGQRVGVPWLGHTCGHCSFCRVGSENLCDRPLFTGYTRDGGFATADRGRCAFRFPHSLRTAAMNPSRHCYVPGSSVGARFAWPEAVAISDCMASVPPRISWRRSCGGKRRQFFAFTLGQGICRPSPSHASWGATWAGDSGQMPPQASRCRHPLRTVRRAGATLALSAVRKGGRVVCAGIHMSDIPSLPYRLLWEERQLLSVANLTRQDGMELLDIVPKAGIRTTTTAYPLRMANEALADLRARPL